MPAQKILLVEDDEDIRDLITDCLTSTGYVVSSCANGQEALDCLRQNGAEIPSLIILDIVMPIMNGYKFREAQLRDARLRRIPIMVMTAGNEKIAENDLFKEVCYISKLLDLDDLFSNIKNLLNQAGAK